jgi:transposase-like protein
MNLLQFQRKFKNEQICRDWLESVRWNNQPVCPHCGHKPYKFKDGKLYKCSECRKQFTVRIGTIFEDSKIPLIKWFLAIYLFTSLKSGLSSIQLSKYIEITQKTSWFMLQRIRKVMKDANNIGLMSGIVEMDETYIGTKEANRHMKDRVKGLKDKISVFGMLERDNKKVKSFKVNDTRAKTLLKEIYTNIEENSLLITDEAKQYQSIGNSYVHRTVNHSQDEYVRDLKGFKLYTNSIEGFWSQVKRGINGIYHWASKKHIDKYLAEYNFRYNERKLDDFIKFEKWFRICEIKNLSYKQLIG